MIGGIGVGVWSVINLSIVAQNSLWIKLPQMTLLNQARELGLMQT
jgi:hypothetical protein